MPRAEHAGIDRCRSVARVRGRACAGIALALLSGGVTGAHTGTQTGTQASAQTTAPPAAPPALVAARPAAEALSPRNASYSIDVTLDPVGQTLTGRQVITWRNVTAAPAAELRLHLYWNAWRNTGSSWLRGRRLDRGVRRADAAADVAQRPEREWGSVDVTALRLLGVGAAPPIELTPSMRFVAPDDGNVLDRTVAAIALPVSVEPGGTINLAVDWTSRIPRTFARTGRIGDFFFLAHWFPKVGVLEPGGWMAHQFHTGTEFYADYGTYDVRITVPAGWVVGATGRAEPVQVRGAHAIHRFVQHDVHDFAWVTSPDLVERRARFEHPRLPAVDMRLLLQPEHTAQADRYFAATRAALRYYGEWFGAYPYGHVTIVDPAWQSGAGGMEYPTLFTGGTRWLAPAGTTMPEGVTVHEAGHQFWYGIVGNDEVRHAWLDEGLNSFATARVLAEAFAPSYHTGRFFGGFVPWVYRTLPLSRETQHNGLAGYRRFAAVDPQNRASWQYDPQGGGAITYAKTALWLHTLERLIGWPALQRSLATFFDRWAFDHPAPADFFAVVNEVSGRDLTWFFDEVHRRSSTFDYGVQHLASAPVALTGFAPDGLAFTRGRDHPGDWETTVVVRRYGEAVFPVDVEIQFEDGQRWRERWDGRDRWRAFTVVKRARAVEARVDPDRVLLLDVNFTNNSQTLRPQATRAGTVLALSWLTWLQDRLLTFGMAF